MVEFFLKITLKRGCQIKRKRGCHTPPTFWGHSRSIPQGMILDVQPLVKSLFCPTKSYPHGFFDFEASIPLKLHTQFWGWGVVGRGGGVNSLCLKDLNQGQVKQSSWADWLGLAVAGWDLKRRQAGC